MITHDTPDHELPSGLRTQIEEANAKIAHKLHQRLQTPVPGNPHGGFPGVNVREHRNSLVQTRRFLIDQWNANNGTSDNA